MQMTAKKQMANGGEYRVVNGNIVEDWPLSGVVELLSQVGVNSAGLARDVGVERE